MWLDSGEGDSEIAYLDPEENGVKWQKNNLYCRAWAPKKRRHQGAIQKGLDDSPMFYVTTNKTGIGEGGYEIEWGRTIYATGFYSFEIGRTNIIH